VGWIQIQYSYILSDANLFFLAASIAIFPNQLAERQEGAQRVRPAASTRWELPHTPRSCCAWCISVFHGLDKPREGSDIDISRRSTNSATPPRPRHGHGGDVRMTAVATMKRDRRGVSAFVLFLAQLRVNGLAGDTVHTAQGDEEWGPPTQPVSQPPQPQSPECDNIEISGSRSELASFINGIYRVGVERTVLNDRVALTKVTSHCQPPPPVFELRDAMLIAQASSRMQRPSSQSKTTPVL
jgi:hypothetical protein